MTIDVHEIIRRLQAGEITPAKAGEMFRQLCEDGGVIEPKQFDQLERRLLFGHPVVEVEGQQQE